MARNKNNMPQSTAGLIRYYGNEGRGAFHIKPVHVVSVASALVVFELALRLLA